MSSADFYTIALKNGYGLIPETRILLDIWQPEMSSTDLRKKALESGCFPNFTARHLHNIIKDCFGPRYLVDKGLAASRLKRVLHILPPSDFAQLLFVFTCRAHSMLADFVRNVYWEKYRAGSPDISNEDGRRFVQQGVDKQRTKVPWSPNTIRRAASDLTACCAEFGLLENGSRSGRRILPFHIAPKTFTYLAHDLHFSGIGDNAILAYDDWQLFGLERTEVLEEFKRLSLKGILILQVAGEAIQISWKQHDVEGLCNVLAKN